MRSRWLSQSSTPGRDAVRFFLTRGLGFVLLLPLAVVVVSWPWQSLLVYLFLLASTVPAAVVETWTLHRARRDPQLRLVISLPPSDDDDAAHRKGDR